MVLDPIPQPLPVHFFGSRPQPPTSHRPCLSHPTKQSYLVTWMSHVLAVTSHLTRWVMWVMSVMSRYMTGVTVSHLSSHKWVTSWQLHHSQHVDRCVLWVRHVSSCERCNGQSCEWCNGQSRFCIWMSHILVVTSQSTCWPMCVVSASCLVIWIM